VACGRLADVGTGSTYILKEESEANPLATSKYSSI